MAWRKEIKEKRGFRKKSEALEFEREFLNKEQKQSDEMTFASLVELYLDDLGTRLKESTLFTKKSIIDSKLLPFFGKMQVKDITSATIRHWQNELMSDGKNYSQTYLRTINNQISTIMNYAVLHYGLLQNPCHIAGSIGRKKAEEMKIWTLDEFNKFIAVVDKPAYKLAFEIMFWCGLRVGETIALTPADILPSKVIDINKTLYRTDGEDRTYDPKTTKSKRKVPIPDFLYNDIWEFINSMYLVENNEKIFYFTKSALNKNLDYYAELAGVKRIRVHDLRHSHASLLIEMNQPILLISERLGHEKVETTWGTYAHLYPDRGKMLADELQKISTKSKDNDS